MSNVSLSVQRPRDNFVSFPAPIEAVWSVIGGGPLRGANPHQKRGQAFWRGSSDWNIAVDLVRNVYFDHVTGSGGSPATLVMQILNCDSREAGQWLRKNFGPLDSLAPKRIVANEEEMNEALMIRISLLWFIESELQLAKFVLWESPWPRLAQLRVPRLTRQLQRVNSWSVDYTIRCLRRLGRRWPRFVEFLYNEVDNFQTELAKAIAGAAQ